MLYLVSEKFIAKLTLYIHSNSSAINFTKFKSSQEPVANPGSHVHPPMDFNGCADSPRLTRVLAEIFTEKIVISGFATADESCIG